MSNSEKVRELLESINYEIEEMKNYGQDTNLKENALEHIQMQALEAINELSTTEELITIKNDTEIHKAKYLIQIQTLSSMIFDQILSMVKDKN